MLRACGFEVGEWYWRATVAAIVVTALAASITVLLYWNRRNIDWQEAEARGEHARPAMPVAAAPPPRTGRQPWPGQPVPPMPAPPQSGLLPWPTYADGTPLPMGPDGQPVFPPTR